MAFAAVLAVGMALPALVAVPLGLPVLRLKGDYLAIATIGFGEVVRLGFVNWDYVNGAQGIVAIPQLAAVWLIYLSLALAIYVFWRLRGSKWGFALEAIREDEPAARTMGIATARYKLAMLVLGASLAGLAGGPEGHFTFMVAPNGFTFGRVVEMLVFADVGEPGRTGGRRRRDLSHAPPRGAPRGRAAGGHPTGAFAAHGQWAGAARRHPVPAEWHRLPPRASARAARGPPRGMSALLRLEGVERGFGGVRAVDGVTFAVVTGAVHGLIGPNGAGKTTLLNLISGLLEPTAGAIVLDGRPIQGLPPHRIAALGIRRTFQNIRLFPELSAHANVLVGEHLHRHPSLCARLLLLPAAAAEERQAGQRAAALLERVGLTDRAGDKARNLSYGEQRRVEIARALAAEPRVLLLDEPTAGMNAEEVQSVARAHPPRGGRRSLRAPRRAQCPAGDGRLRQHHRAQLRQGDRDDRRRMSRRMPR